MRGCARCALLLIVFACLAGQAFAEVKQVALVRQARTVLKAALDAESKPLTVEQLGRAHGIAIFPGVVKAGFIVGGRFGSGILLIRAGTDWSDPLFVSLVSASVGWQVGVQSMDLVLLFNTPLEAEQLASGNVAIGADAGLSAGGVGGHVEGASGLGQEQPVVVYAPAKGLFAGLSLEGTALQIDPEGTAAYYATEGVTVQQVLMAQVRERPLAGQRLQLELNELVPPPK